MAPRSKEGGSFARNSSESATPAIVYRSGSCTIRYIDPNQALVANSKISQTKKPKSHGPMIGGALPSGCSPGDLKKLALSLSVLVDYSCLFGFRKEAYKTESTLLHWQLCSAECGWIKFLKYKLAAFMAYHLGNPLPEKPFSREDHPNQFAGGALGRFVNLLMKTDRGLSYAVGVLYSKKGMPRPGIDALNKAIVDTTKVLTEPKARPVFDISSDSNVKQEIRRTCREVFSRRITRRSLLKPYAPSIRANYVDSRSAFGTFGTLYEESLLMNRVPPEMVNLLYEQALEESRNEEIEDEDTLVLTVSHTFRKKVNEAYESAWEQARDRAREEAADLSWLPYLRR
jgi:hypothetical protein